MATAERKRPSSGKRIDGLRFVVRETRITTIRIDAKLTWTITVVNMALTVAVTVLNRDFLTR